MSVFGRFRHAPRTLVASLVVGLVLFTSGVVAGGSLVLPKITTPKTEDQVTNVDIARLEIKNYYGTPNAATGSGATGGWTLPLNMDSNYAAEAESVATDGTRWLESQANSNKPSGMKAIVLDVDDTTLTTYDYELYSNWDYNPGTNTVFVGGSGGTFTGNVFPATPGMVEMVQHAKDLGYAVFFITGRGDSQHSQTIANLVSDTAAGYGDIATVTSLSAPVPEVDAGYPMPDPIDHGSFTDGLFTKPAVGSYPAYLDKPEFCGQAIADGKSCGTIQYKSGTRAYIESQGYTIVGNFGDQFSDLLGGFAVKTFKMPNPNYYLP